MRGLGISALTVTLFVTGLVGQSNSTVSVIRNVRIFDGERTRDNQTVVLSDGLITAMADSSEARPSGAEEIDGRNRTLLPGLIDAHVHLSTFYPEQALQQSLAFGVTTVVNMWTSPPPKTFTGKSGLVRMKEIEAADAHDMSGLLTAGTGASAKGGHPSQMEPGNTGTPTIESPDEAPAFVAARLAEGSDFLKIIYDDTAAAYGRTLPMLSEATMAALTTAAHGQKRLAVAHIGTERHAISAITAGIDGLAHLFVGPTVSREFVQSAAGRNVFVIPTLSILYSVCGQSDGQQILDDPRMMSRVRSEFSAPLSWPDGGVKPSCAGAKAAVRQLSEAGVAIVAGTDAPGAGTTYGASLHWELAHLVDAGMSPTAALASATSVAARAFRMTDRGRIATGLRADLLLVDGDPTKDIRATRNIVRIWKRGVARE